MQNSAHLSIHSWDRKFEIVRYPERPHSFFDYAQLEVIKVNFKVPEFLSNQFILSFILEIEPKLEPQDYSEATPIFNSADLNKNFFSHFLTFVNFHKTAKNQAFS